MGSKIFRFLLLSGAFIAFLTGLIAALNANARANPQPSGCLIVAVEDPAQTPPIRTLMFDFASGKRLNLERMPTEYRVDTLIEAPDRSGRLYIRYQPNLSLVERANSTIFFQNRDGAVIRLQDAQLLDWGGGAYAPDGNQMAYVWSKPTTGQGRRGFVTVMNAQGGERRDVELPFAGQYGFAGWSADGTVFAVRTHNAERVLVWFYMPATGKKEIHTLPDNELSFANDSAFWSPVGHTLAYTSHDNHTGEVVFVTPGVEPRRIALPPGDTSSSWWSPDGSALLVKEGRAEGPTIRLMLHIVGIDGIVQENLAQTLSNSQIFSMNAHPRWLTDGGGFLYIDRVERANTINILAGDLMLVRLVDGKAQPAKRIAANVLMDQVPPQARFPMTILRQNGRKDAALIRDDGTGFEVIAEDQPDFALVFENSDQVYGAITREGEESWLHLLRLSDGKRLRYGPMYYFVLGLWVEHQSGLMPFRYVNTPGSGRPDANAYRSYALDALNLSVMPLGAGSFNLLQGAGFEGYAVMELDSASGKRQYKLYDFTLKLRGVFPANRGGDAMIISVAPDGRALLYPDEAYNGYGYDLWLTAANGKETPLGIANRADSAWSNDNALVAVADWDYGRAGVMIRAVDANTGMERWRKQFPSATRLNRPLATTTCGPEDFYNGVELRGID